MDLNDAQKNVNRAPHSESPEAIRERLSGHRSALTDKLGELETQIEDRILVAVDRIALDVEASVHKVSESFQTSVDRMAQTVHTTIERVDSNLQNAVDSVAQSIDIKQQFEDRPLAMIALSVCAGAIATRLLTGGLTRRRALH